MPGETRPEVPKGAVAGPELFVALVGAVGTDVGLAIEVLKEELQSVGYTASEIRLSHLLAQSRKYRHLKTLHAGPEDERIDQSMDAGDDLRRTMARGDAVLLLGISKIREIRKAECGDNMRPLPRRAYIINSLKHPKEVDTLRRIYGDAAVILSLYAPKQERVERLAHRIAVTRHNSEIDLYRAKAEALVAKDEKEVGDELGQNVRDAFPKADVFFRMAVKETLRSHIGRFVRLLFGHPFQTPTIDEYAQFHASAAALRSADLSRQVGAVIMTTEGDIIAAGCNEVPKAGGGAVWAGADGVAESDYRDFRLGADASAIMKEELLGELFRTLQDAGWFSRRYARREVDKLVIEALYQENALLKHARAANILEFGRIVHAEMSAITGAARRGLSVQDATLYCTTFPCHMCARHIVAAGIQRVIYIEPYPKSVVKRLYPKMIRVESDAADADAVSFEPFVGVAPRRFIDFFEKPERKNKRGKILQWQGSRAFPRVNATLPIHPEIEAVHIDLLMEHQMRHGLVPARRRTRRR